MAQEQLQASQGPAILQEALDADRCRDFAGFPPEDHKWCINDTAAAGYFRKIHWPPDITRMDWLLHRTAQPGDVGLDIAGGSNARALRDLIQTKVISHGLVTNYQDRRISKVKNDPRIGHVAGDILTKEVWCEIDNWRQTHAPNGFGLILHRPFGGLQKLTPEFYGWAAHNLINMLRTGGVMFSQVPSVVEGYNLRGVYDSIRLRPDVAKARLGRRDRTPKDYILILKSGSPDTTN